MKANKQIEKSTVAIKDVMQENLALIAESIIDQVMKNLKKSTPSNAINSTKNVKARGVNQYKSDLKAGMAVISSLALDQARSEVPSAKKVKLMENEERLLFGEFEELPSDIKKRINNANQLLIGTQIADLEKSIFFQFNSSLSAEKPVKEIESDMTDKAESYITGNAINAGAAVTSANIVNEARNAFFFTKDVLDEIEAFQVMNDSPVSAICRELAGQIFPKNDPNHFRYTFPLHYRCKSWIRPILKLTKGMKVERLNPTKTAKASIQFFEGDMNTVFNVKCGCC